jgi:hypothetical protein
MKSLTNCEKPSSNRLHGLILSFQEPPVTLKVVPKAGHECTLKKATNEREENPEQKLVRLSEQSLDLVLFSKK